MAGSTRREPRLMRLVAGSAGVTWASGSTGCAEAGSSAGATTAGSVAGGSAAAAAQLSVIPSAARNLVPHEIPRRCAPRDDMSARDVAAVEDLEDLVVDAFADAL